MNYSRREFLNKGIFGAGALILGSQIPLFSQTETTKTDNEKPNVPLKLSFQEGTLDFDSLNAKFDYMEQYGIEGFEPWGKGLSEKINEIQDKLKGRNIKVSAICAGFKGFILSTNKEVLEEFMTTYKELLILAGELKSVGVIMVPAFNHQQPYNPHTIETRERLVEQLSELGEFAMKHNTSVILEPLNRKEAYFLRQVADAASICRDVNNKGVTCMGDFWHMTFEETSDYGAFYSGGDYLSHVHVASRKRRLMPGEDDKFDNYVDGFKALKQMNYQGYVSFECGSAGNRTETVPAALQLLRKQWEIA